MAFEIDFLAVGDGSRGGDAIALRYGNLTGDRTEQTVVVIDGGTQTSGEALVKLIRDAYGTSFVNFALSKHPDADHACGLAVVMENLGIGTLLMHRPWDHASEIRSLFQDGRLTATGLEEKIARALDDAYELEKIAKRKNVAIAEPFAGVSTTDGAMLVLGPERDYYQSLICGFRRTPEPKSMSAFATPFRKAGEAVNWIKEMLDVETLDDFGTTSPENNSSAVLLLQSDNYKLLFTGDAGIDALARAANYAAMQGIRLDDLHFLQVPHHGSHNNVGPTILNRIQGKTAYVSAPRKGDPTHPSRKVANALKRRGAMVFATKGTNLWHHVGAAPNRVGYGPVESLPFYEMVED